MTRDYSHLFLHRVQKDLAGTTRAEGHDFADLIDKLAADMEPTLATAFRTAAADLASAIDIEALAEAIRTGNMIEAIRVAGVEENGAAFGGLWPPLQQVMRQAAGAATMKFAQIRFSLVNPATERFLETYGMGQIRQIGEDTREAIRQVVSDGVLNGINPIEQARDVRDVVEFGLTKQQAKAVQNYRRELQTQSSGALNRALRDARFDPSVKRAIKQDRPLTDGQVDRMVEAYQRRSLKHRAETIARTESMRATNAGAMGGLAQAIDRGTLDEARMLKNWMVAKDERTCPICLEIARLNRAGVPFRGQFQTAKGVLDLPPAHPLCRCVVWYWLKEGD